MSAEFLAIALILVVHAIGAAALIWALFGEEGADWKGWWPDDGDGGHDAEPPPRPGPGPDALPLPDATPSAQRLRGPERIGAWRRHHARPRPEHAPAPAPQPGRRAPTPR